MSSELFAGPVAELWLPPTGLGRYSQHARHLLGYLRRWKGQSASNPWWPQYFWQDVSRMETTTGLETNILRLLRTPGYAGAGTVAVPAPELATEQLSLFQQILR